MMDAQVVDPMESNHQVYDEEAQSRGNQNLVRLPQKVEVPFRNDVSSSRIIVAID
jgi:hypothetical protein